MKRRRIEEPGRSPAQDAEVARLTARADLIVEELETVVQQMSAMLRNAYGQDDD